MTIDQLSKLLGTFDPAAARKEHAANVKLWQLYLDLLEADRTKIQAMVEKHHADEPETKVTLRKTYAAVLNLIPSIIRMVQGYVYAEEPQIDVKGDKDLEAFLKDCDGTGRPFVEFCRQRVLPLALAMGWVDVLIQNPQVDGLITAADAQGAGLAPVAYCVTPLKRNHWSVAPNGEYHWMRFKDANVESRNPFVTSDIPVEVYITLSAAGALDGASADVGWWLRSQREAGKWMHTSGPTPTRRVPTATLYYAESVDPDKPHWGVSKIAQMAVLTNLIVQVLSWTTEDILSNLALLAIPSASGKPPQNEAGENNIQELTAATILWYSAAATHQPGYIQGDVSHITAKLAFIDLLIREILRLAHMIGASAEAEKITSGVQGIVMRSELHQELAGIATGLDTFTIDCLALAKSWATGKDITRKMMMEDASAPTVNHFKGPYAIDPLTDVIANAEKLVAMYRDVSPKMVEATYLQVARSALYAGDPMLTGIVKEILTNAKAVLEQQAKREQLVFANEIAGTEATDATPPNEEAA